MVTLAKAMVATEWHEKNGCGYGQEVWNEDDDGLDGHPWRILVFGMEVANFPLDNLNHI